MSNSNRLGERSFFSGIPHPHLLGGRVPSHSLNRYHVETLFPQDLVKLRVH